MNKSEQKSRNPKIKLGSDEFIFLKGYGLPNESEELVPELEEIEPIENDKMEADTSALIIDPNETRNCRVCRKRRKRSSVKCVTLKSELLLLATAFTLKKDISRKEAAKFQHLSHIFSCRSHIDEAINEIRRKLGIDSFIRNESVEDQIELLTIIESWQIEVDAPEFLQAFWDVVGRHEKTHKKNYIRSCSLCSELSSNHPMTLIRVNKVKVIVAVGLILSGQKTIREANNIINQKASFICNNHFPEIINSIYKSLGGRIADNHFMTQRSREVMDIVNTFAPSWKFPRFCVSLKSLRLQNGVEKTPFKRAQPVGSPRDIQMGSEALILEEEERPMSNDYSMFDLPAPSLVEPNLLNEPTPQLYSDPLSLHPSNSTTSLIDLTSNGPDCSAPKLYSELLSLHPNNSATSLINTSSSDGHSTPKKYSDPLKPYSSVQLFPENWTKSLNDPFVYKSYKPRKPYRRWKETVYKPIYSGPPPTLNRPPSVTSDPKTFNFSIDFSNFSGPNPSFNQLPSSKRSNRLCTICYKTQFPNNIVFTQSQNLKLILMTGLIFKGTKSIQEARDFLNGSFSYVCKSHFINAVGEIYEFLGIQDIDMQVCSMDKAQELMITVNCLNSEYTFEEFCEVLRELKLVEIPIKNEQPTMQKQESLYIKVEPQGADDYLEF